MTQALLMGNLMRLELTCVSSFIEYPINKPLCHICSDKSNKLETYMYVRTK